jgi:hypothetical protein
MLHATDLIHLSLVILMRGMGCARKRERERERNDKNKDVKRNIAMLSNKD